MGSNSRQRRALQQAWMTELQAIAIYEAEIAVLSHTHWTKHRTKTLALWREILLEEREHLKAVVGPFHSGKLLQLVAQLSGWCVGSVLAAFPARFSWWLHSTAEKQAAQTYEDLIPLISDPLLRGEIEQAAQQERDHSRRFTDLSSQFKHFHSGVLK